MKKTIAIIAIALSVLFVSKDAKAGLKVYNFTGLQMNIRLSDGFSCGVSSTTGSTYFSGPNPIFVDAAKSYPGHVYGGTGMGIVEWLAVGEFPLPSIATSSYTWGSVIYGPTTYTVIYSETVSDIVLTFVAP